MERANRFFPYAIYILTFVLILFVRLSIPIENFADFEGYIISIERILSDHSGSWLISDPFGWGPIIALYYWLNNIHQAIFWSNISLSVIFFIGLIYIGERYGIFWQGLLVFICLFGGLLAFVTIRATPAYLLVAIAALEVNNRKQLKPILLVFAAALFHGSAILAVPGIAAALLCHKSKILLSWVERPQKIFIALCLLLVPVVLFQQQFQSLLYSVVDTFSGTFGRFTTYIPSTQDTSSVDPNARSGSDIFYTVSVFIAFAAFMLYSSRTAVRFRAFVLVSFIVYVAMLFQPTAAFRQSLYWLIPMILIFPWRKFEFGGIGNIVLIIGCVVVGYFGLLSVLL